MPFPCMLAKAVIDCGLLEYITIDEYGKLLATCNVFRIKCKLPSLSSFVSLHLCKGVTNGGCQCSLKPKHSFNGSTLCGNHYKKECLTTVLQVPVSLLMPKLTRSTIVEEGEEAKVQLYINSPNSACTMGFSRMLYLVPRISKS